MACSSLGICILFPLSVTKNKLCKQINCVLRVVPFCTVPAVGETLEKSGKTIGDARSTLWRFSLRSFSFKKKQPLPPRFRFAHYVVPESKPTYTPIVLFLCPTPPQGTFIFCFRLRFPNTRSVVWGDDEINGNTCLVKTTNRRRFPRIISDGPSALPSTGVKRGKRQNGNDQRDGDPIRNDPRRRLRASRKVRAFVSFAGVNVVYDETARAREIAD